MEQGESSSKNQLQPPLVDRILQYGQLAFDPELPEETRKQNQPQFLNLLQSTGTLALIPALNLLVQTGRTQPWLRAPLISTLATLPLRERGVQNTIEFVLSVHPSSAGYNTSANAGKGSGISHEALNAASRLLSSPPSGMSPIKWFSGIAPQLFALLQGEGEPEMDRAAAFIIGFGILGKRQYGAPGTPGWIAFVEPIYRYIDPTMVSHMTAPKGEEIITLDAGKILASSSEVSQSLRRLSTLLTTHPHPSLTKRLLAPIMLPLWALSSWEGDENIENDYRKPARNLLKTYLQLSSSVIKSAEGTVQPAPSQNLTVIVKNLVWKGNSDPSRLQWIYAQSQDGGIQIKERPLTAGPQIVTSELDLTAIDHAAASFIVLIDTLTELDAEISQLFMTLCRKWLTDDSASRTEPELTLSEPSGADEDMGHRLIEAKVMQNMMTLVPGKLVDDSRQVLELVCQILTQFVRGKDDGTEDTVSVALSLFNLVLTSARFQPTPQLTPTLEAISSSLDSISKRSELESSLTARNLLLLLSFKTNIEDPVNLTSMNTDQQMVDRKTYNLALSYLTAIDSPTPVRAQGLELISSLVKYSSSILDIPALVVLFSSLLQDNDEYIYLRVIKSYIELSLKHPKAVMKDLVERYVDLNEDAELDQRLRFGEALIQVIQKSSISFSGETARTVCEGLISIAGRRGYRPKSEKEQEKRNRLKRKKDQDAEEAWGGEVPQFEDNLTPENEILAQIVAGWESKRGTEDVRIRASSLSILGSAIESNIAGIRSNLISIALDLSIHILTLELGPEKGILRRSAVLFIMSFVKALDEARTDGEKLGFGLVGQNLDDVLRILKYVEDTDNDGLVRQHARDVVEGLQTWQIKSLLPPRNDQTEIQQLAGLSINPVDDSQFRGRPRIEEIE